MRLSMGLAAIAAALLRPCNAQQYQGDIIPNSLPSVPGSEIAYFRVNDPSGKNKNLTLINYYSHGKGNKRLVESNVQRAVIIVHGLNRDPGTYIANMMSALAQTTSNSNVNFDTVAIMAPYFTNGDDKGFGYPWTDGLAPARGSTSNALVWKASQWSAGGNNQYPYTSRNTSSYTVLDQIVRYFDDKQLFPRMNQIVVAGHSLGGQTIQRYAALGAQLGTQSPVSYWVGNPNSYVWLSTSRPLSTASCPTYDNYREGYNDFVDYPMTYGAGLVAQGRSAILANFNSKAVNYARGTQDLGDDSSTCAPSTTGSNRNERFFNFIKAFPPSCPDPKGRNCDTVDFVNMGHDGGGMMASAAGQARLFLDNFSGDGNRSYDFGYPRQQAGDDPYPDPTLNTTAASVNNNTYAGNMTYWGCWSDQTPKTLPNLAYSNNVNTIELCAQTCAAGGNSIAGLQFGTQCFCGKALGYLATQVIDSSCSMACPGNSTEKCGGSNRLSIFSAGRPALLQAPGTPETVGDYYYVSCYTEASNGARALPAKSMSSNSMSLEACASFCSGYQYFGTEYGSECYCGNDFSAGANRTSDSDCNMLCSGASNEFCGAGDRLTVYQDPNWTGSGSSSSSSSSSSSTAGPTSTSGPGAPPVLCPASNDTTVTSNGKTFAVECGIDHAGGDLTSLSVTSFQQCIDTCGQNDKCVVVALSGSACYLKSSVGAPINNGVWGARLVPVSSTASISSSSTSDSASSSSLSTGVLTSSSVSNTATSSSSSNTVTTSTSTSSSASASPTSINCPGSNSTTYVSNGLSFLIECGIDHVGGDMKAVTASNLKQCIDACAATSGCVDVSFLGAACYMKSTLGAAVYNGVNGAKLIQGASSSSLVASSTTSTSEASSSSPTDSVSSTSVISTSSNTQSVPSTTLLTSTLTSSPTSTSTSSSQTSSSLTSTTSTVTESSALPSGYTSLGCFIDPSSSRLFPKQIDSTNTNTPQTCALACSAQNYKYSGTQYGSECWCSNTAPRTTSSAPSTNCNMKCAGDKTQFCGAGNRMNIVEHTTWKPSFFARPTYGQFWALKGCYTDSTSTRTLAHPVSLAAHGGAANATVANCLNACDDQGYWFCGVEYYSECWGSGFMDQPKGKEAGTSMALGGDPLEQGCDYPCRGNRTESCGGANRILVYARDGGN